jgi:adenylylsulfate kinase-like enzyme
MTEHSKQWLKDDLAQKKEIVIIAHMNDKAIKNNVITEKHIATSSQLFKQADEVLYIKSISKEIKELHFVKDRYDTNLAKDLVITLDFNTVTFNNTSNETYRLENK